MRGPVGVTADGQGITVSARDSGELGGEGDGRPGVAGH